MSFTFNRYIRELCLGVVLTLSLLATVSCYEVSKEDLALAAQTKSNGISEAPEGYFTESSTSEIDQTLAQFPIPKKARRITVSMRVLSQKVRSCIAAGVRPTEECLTLAGMDYIEGVFADDIGEKDLLLVGLVSDPPRPKIYLDDLIQAMRSVPGANEYPYCSLDPTPESIKKLNKLFRSLVLNPDDPGPAMEKLSQAIGQQQVVLGGVRRNSRFAHVMVNADYHMKKVSQGLDRVTGVPSCLDIALDTGKTQASMSRFWFHIGADGPTYKHVNGAVWLDKCDVVLLTERQEASASGELSDVQEDDPVATAFARNFSEKFKALTAIIPGYSDIENLYRLRAVLLAIEHQQAMSVLGEDMSSYLAEYPYFFETSMPSSYDGLVNHKIAGNCIMLVCGGVGMDMQASESVATEQEQEFLSALFTAAIESRPSEYSLAWPVYCKL